MKVLMIGGNGFIGSYVTKALVAQGHQVRCMLRSTSKTDRIDGVDYERHAGDICDKATIASGLEGCDAVVHLASPSAWRDINSPMLEKIVLEGTRNVLEAARDAGARVVFCSTITAVNASEEPEVFDETSEFTLPVKGLRYSEAKREAEAMCREFAREGTHVVIVNPAEVYGPLDTELITAGNLIDFANSSPVLVCKGGTSVVHVEDVALGVVRAMERGTPGERYILGGENLTIRELAERALGLLGLKKKIVTVPNPMLRAGTKLASSLRIPLPFEPGTIPYATRYWFMDNSKATRELGVEFRSADEALEPTLAWLQETGRIEGNQAKAS